MRTTTLKSYLYQQYTDDDNLQAWVDAYNGATQTLVDWFNQVGLPYYPGLKGDLLTWVAKGLYGQDRTQLASSLTPALGALGTLVPLNTLRPLDSYVPSSQTFYNLTDDVLQRILTWNFFKGDGRRFSIRWLKRRVIRFLLGTNGIDPQPTVVNADGSVSLNPNFQIGAETTSAIGVAISGGVCTVSIDQSLLSLQAPNISPGILLLFQLAFQGGNLELPLKYTYAVSIIVNFVALARPNVVTSTSSAFNQTTPVTIVSVLGGTGNYLYAWSFLQPGLQAAAEIVTAATGVLTTREQLAGAATEVVTATGALTGALGGSAQVSAAAAGALTTGASFAGNALEVSGATATFTGTAQLKIDSPTSLSTTFTATGMTGGQVLSAIAQCAVTDTVSGLVALATCEVIITCVAAAQILTEGGVPILTEGQIPITVEP